jgi:hypothetical protein
MTSRTVTLYRAADSDILPSDSASFSESREAAEAYMGGRNPGYGGAALWSTEIEIDLDSESVLDLVEVRDGVQVIADRIGRAHPGAIGADEWAPRVSYELRDAGVVWVRVQESYPEDSITWIFVGAYDVAPEMTEVE